MEAAFSNTRRRGRQAGEDKGRTGHADHEAARQATDEISELEEKREQSFEVVQAHSLERPERLSRRKRAWRARMGYMVSVPARRYLNVARFSRAAALN